MCSFLVSYGYEGVWFSLGYFACVDFVSARTLLAASLLYILWVVQLVFLVGLVRKLVRRKCPILQGTTMDMRQPTRIVVNIGPPFPIVFTGEPTTNIEKQLKPPSNS